MKCPLRSVATHYPEEQCGLDTFDCLKEECAWWMPELSLCAVNQLAHHLWLLQGDIADIIAKMPHEGQFRT